MDDQRNKIGDINANAGNISFGSDTTNTINNGISSKQTELLQAIKLLQNTIRTSPDLTDSIKRDQLDITNDLEQESKKSNPNMTKLKMLTDGLTLALSAIPSITSAITAVAALLPKP